MDKAKEKIVVKFPDKDGKKADDKSGTHELYALSFDGKRLLRLQPTTSKEHPPKKCQLIGVLTEKNANSTTTTATRHPIRLQPKTGGAQPPSSPENEENNGAATTVGPIKQKIPRPANAFMLFANEWRKKLASENPRESNKDISVRLGVLWKTMSKDVKEKYFGLAREVDAEHKRKYPDYVYNPKEARLRKAMREQSRSTTTTTTSAAAAAAAAAAAVAASNSSSILHQQQQQGVGTAPQPQQQQQQQGVAGGVSPLPGGGPAAANRIIGPWFPPQPSTHPKPILSPRVMAAHQRTLDKTKDVIRKQLEGYPAYHHHHQQQQQQQQQQHQDYGMPQENHHHHHHPFHQQNNHHHHHHPQDYCDYADRQKWHPYQNGANAYHSRGALMSKMNSLHHRGMPSPPTHPTSPWGQFCNVPFPSSQSAMMRSNRHMVFLPEHHHQQQMSHQQHCGYPDELRLSYEAKMQDDLARRLHPASYPPQDQQMKSPLASLHELAHDDGKSLNGNLQSGLDDGPRWDTPRPSSVSSSSCTTDTLLERESELQHQPPAAHQQQRSTKPLPGFQQAFGSTEIGKFSRSELFASLVEAATNNNFTKSNELSNRSHTDPSNTVPTDPLTKLKADELKKRLISDKCLWILKREHAPLKSAKTTTITLKQPLLPSPDHRRDCACMRLPPDSKKTETQQVECLDLRVPARKAATENKENESPDSSVDIVLDDLEI